MNINEKFLLKLIEDTDYIFCAKDSENFYFSPNGFDVEIKIPYSHSSTQINIHFIYSFDDVNNKPHKETINFSFASPNEIKEFMFALYKKYELGLNEGYGNLSKEIIDKFETMLKQSDSIKGLDDNNAHISYINGKENYYVDINDAAFSYGKRIKFRPLSPLIIPCYYNTGNTEKIYKKVIPAYLIHEYPPLIKIAKVEPVVKNIHELQNVLDSLKLLNPKSASILNALILDVELDKNTPIKNSKPKL
jgi:hypothetical protein